MADSARCTQIQQKSKGATLKIEKNIPLKKKGGWGIKTNLINSMDIDDSFVVDTEDETRVYRQLFYRHNKKCKIRQLDDGTFRIWRSQ